MQNENTFFGPGSRNAMKLHWRRTLVHFFLCSAFYLRKAAKFLRTQSSAATPDCAFAPSHLCVKTFVLLCSFVSLWFNSSAQLNTDNQFTKPLKEVLNDIQKKYGVVIKFDEK